MKKIPIGKNCFTVVSSEDYDTVKRFNWHKTEQGYVRGRIGSSLVFLHRFIMAPKGSKKVDHINGDRLDNTRKNLRIVTSSVNNQSKLNVRKLPFIGVKKMASGKYNASLNINNKRIYLGTYDSPIEAAKTYDKKVLELYGEHAMTNKKMLEKLLALLQLKK